MLFEVTLYFYKWYFVCTSEQTDALQCQWILMFMTLVPSLINPVSMNFYSLIQLNHVRASY